MPGRVPDIAAPMEGLEQLLLILVRDADALIANDAHRVRPVPFHCEMHRRSRLRIFYSVAQQIRENVPEQSFIRVGFRVERSSATIR